MVRKNLYFFQIKLASDKSKRMIKITASTASTASTAMLVVGLMCFLFSSTAVSSTFDLPQDDSTVVGSVRVVLPSRENTLVDIARNFDLGYHEITWANPGVDIWLPGEGVEVVVPTQFILPPKPWRGIVINIPQRRMFYFPVAEKGKRGRVISMPVSIGREGWPTPLGDTTVVAKHRDPAWFVPPSIRREKREEGVPDFPVYFPPGPDNPMGMLAIQTGFKGIFIHGTNRPWGVGMRVSHGCLHLYPEDAATLFPLIKVGIPVRVIDQSVVVGVQAGKLVMANYNPVSEYGASKNSMTRAVLALAPHLQNKNGEGKPRYEVDWKRVDAQLNSWQVLPVEISIDGQTLRENIAKITVELYNLPPYDVNANTAMPPGDALEAGLESGSEAGSEVSRRDTENRR